MRRTRVSCKVTRCTKLRGAQRSPELALRNMDFRAPENLIFPALLLIRHRLAHIFFLSEKNVEKFGKSSKVK